jgi:hypothetical protein
MNEITRIAIDTSKSVFTLHGVDAAGRAVLRRNLRRSEVVAFFEKQPAVEARVARVARIPMNRRVGETHRRNLVVARSTSFPPFGQFAAATIPIGRIQAASHATMERRERPASVGRISGAPCAVASCYAASLGPQRIFPRHRVAAIIRHATTLPRPCADRQERHIAAAAARAACDGAWRSAYAPYAC